MIINTCIVHCSLTSLTSLNSISDSVQSSCGPPTHTVSKDFDFPFITTVQGNSKGSIQVRDIAVHP